MTKEKKINNETKIRGMRLRARTNNPSALALVIPDIAVRLKKIQNIEDGAKKASEKIIKYGISPKTVQRLKSRFVRDEVHEVLIKPIGGDAHSVGDYLEIEVFTAPHSKPN